MAAHAGEKAEKTGDFRCEKCHQRVHVKAGEHIPKCPHCGNDTYGSRENDRAKKAYPAARWRRRGGGASAAVKHDSTASSDSVTSTGVPNTVVVLMNDSSP